jgi:hypothetical protein
VITPPLPLLLQLKIPSQGILGTWTSHWGFMGNHRSIPTGSDRPCFTGEQSWNQNWIPYPSLPDGWKPWPIEFHDFPLRIVMFHSKLLPHFRWSKRPSKMIGFGMSGLRSILGDLRYLRFLWLVAKSCTRQGNYW